MAFLPPGGPTEIVFSLDTTGSMSAILEEVQARLQDMIQRLQSDIPGIKISIIAHGDYCDAEHFYVTKHIDFCDSIPQLCDFVNDIGGTGGGDVPECYEFVLRKVREDFSWQPMSQKVLIMIGDAYPHDADYPANTLNLDWKEEVKDLAKMGVRIYGVQVGDDETSRDFFTTMAGESGGQFLKLADFSNICTFIMAICYRERGDEFLSGFEAEIRAGKGKATFGKDLEGLFGTLRRDESMESEVSGPSGFVVPSPVSPINSFTDKTSAKPKTAKPIKAKPVKASKTKPPKAVAAKAANPRKRHVIVKKTASKVTVTRKVKGGKKLKREKVTRNAFAYNDCKWSKWHLALVSWNDKDLVDESRSQWKSLSKGLQFKRRSINLCPNANARSDTFVEVAVQARPHTKRHVVMFKVLHGKHSPCTWYRSLFGKRVIKRELKNVVNKGCKVFVRSAVLKRSKQSAAMVTKDISGVYDYAWQTRRDIQLSRYDMCISHHTF